jgi:imidazolonepropionase-like amidohydrolase
MTSTAGELAAMTGKNNPYPGKLGVIEEGALADMLIVDGNPKWFGAEPRGEDIDTIRLIVKDGAIYKDTL